jgi:hypothetical protein
MDRDEMRKFYRGPPIDASYQVSVHLAKRFQRRRFFRNQPIRNKNCLWRPRDYFYHPQNNYTTSQITAFLAHLANSSFWLVDFWKIFSSEIALSNDLKLGRKLLWKVLYKCSFRPKSANQKQESPVVAMFVNRSGRNEHL